MSVRNTRDHAAASRRRLPLSALLATLTALPLLAACGGLSQSGQGTPLQDSPIVTEADEGAIAEALAAGVDSADVEAAAEEAGEMVGRLDEPTRREFYRLFGADPLGLSSRPVNAARYEIPLEMNEQVERWIEYFTTGDGRVRFRIYLERAGQYEAMIRERARAAELPEDLLYLALIESGMNPNAYSRSRAVGLWQFMTATGRAYGLEVDYWLDERRDPFLATEAAIAHLGDLYERFGSWYLAAAAYNAGAGRVSRGIRRVGSDDFWDLADSRVLHPETRNYVPKLLAAATIARNPERYGFDDVVPMPPIEFDVVQVPDATSFDVLAEAAGTSEDVIKALNPQFVRQVTPPQRAVEVRVPPGMAAEFSTAYAQIPPDERVTWLEHRVTRGQTLGAIAGRYGTSVSAIRAANNNVNPRRLQIGQRLVIPRDRGTRMAASGGGATSSATAALADGPVTVTVRNGDTLWSIARRYGTSTSALMASNGLSSSVIHPGDRITINR
ncbi:MAG TPA: LysM peptidoglycan-binding domain-containing protein [Gemmatimonadota bacterium]|nr:LysM peptidoglycan-binding domain-containing protein [Gemmatimonadota bacterium]